MKLLVVSDAWHPQVNGVVRILERLSAELTRQGHEVEVIGPAGFFGLAMPRYPEIRLALLPYRRLGRRMRAAGADAIHIATEGPLGFAARRYCLRHKLPFTTAFHTRFPEYFAERFKAVPLPLSAGYALLRHFHRPSARVMVTTQSLADALVPRGLRRLERCTPGVDTDAFRPGLAPLYPDLPRPVHLFVGRLASEKNLDAFLALDLPGTKLLVGDGPEAAEMRRRYPGAIFTGRLTGEELARAYATADVFVFPSRTDTFGLVLLEALASGVPVAALPVPGPNDIIGPTLGTAHPAGALHEDLGTAIAAARLCSPADCRARALAFSWSATARIFLAAQVPLRPGAGPVEVAAEAPAEAAA